MKTYKYRLYPNKVQAKAIDEMINRHRWLYNEALAQRRDSWEQEQKSVKYTDQSQWLTQHRKENETYQNLNFSSCQRTLKRLDRAFQAFFRRVKAGENSPFPRGNSPHPKAYQSGLFYLWCNCKERLGCSCSSMSSLWTCLRP